MSRPTSSPPHSSPPHSSGPPDSARPADAGPAGSTSFVEGSAAPRFLAPFPPVDARAWREKVEADLKGADFDRALVHRTVDGLEVQPLYHPQNAAAADALAPPPGVAPHTRGTAVGSGDRTVALGIDARDPREANRRLLHGLGLGVGLPWLHLRPSEAPRAGTSAAPSSASESAPASVFESSAPHSKGGQSKGGQSRAVEVDGLDALDALLDGVEPEYIAFFVDGGAHTSAYTALFAAWARNRDRQLGALSGCWGFDPLACLAREGHLPGSLDGAWNQASRLVQLCRDLARDRAREAGESPVAEVSPAPASGTAEAQPATPTPWAALALRTDVYHDAGASPVQQLAYGLATGLEALRQLEQRGIRPLDTALQVWPVLAVDTEIFLEIAKLRAWRCLWTKLLTAAGAAEAAGVQTLHVRSSNVSATVVDPWVNLLRATAQTFVGTLAGADSILVGPYDRRLAGDEADSARRVAINTQHVLGQEGHLGRITDPAGGSWAIETLTEQLARAAWQEFREIEALGGMGQALVDGEIERRIAATVEARRKEIDRRRRLVVGVSAFPDLSKRESASGRAAPPTAAEPSSAPAPDPSRAAASQSPAGPTADQATWGDEPTLDWADPISWIDTIGELGVGRLSASLWSGRQATAPPLRPYLAAADFEALRLEVDRVGLEAGPRREAESDVFRRPAVFAARLGRPSESRARAEFTAGLVAAAGFVTVESEVDPAAESAPSGAEGSSAEARLADAFGRSGARVAVLCSTDERYPEWVPRFAAVLREAGAERLYLAGRPGDGEAEYRAAGVDGFLYLGCDVRSVLHDLAESILGEGGRS